MILVYYGAGLRLREATNLTRADVDLSGSILTIRNTKFGKTRLVPVGPQLSRVLVQYDRTRPKGRPADAPFFVTATGGPIGMRLLEQELPTFRAIARASAGLTHANNRGFTTCAIRSPFTVSPPGISRVPTYSDSCTNLSVYLGHVHLQAHASVPEHDARASS